ncbi:MAG: hypothetical protein Roseis2KO_32460 [Roseivirga sp.]
MNYKSNLTLDKHYTASKTELLVGQVVIPSGGTKGTIQIILIDGSTETVLACASAQRVAGGTPNPSNSASAVIHANEQYKIVLLRDSATDADGYAYYSAI